MALTTTSTVDQITVESNGIILIRTNIQVLDGTNIIANNYQRSSLNPGDSLTGQDPSVVAIANTVWTPSVISAYQAQFATLNADFSKNTTT